MELEDLKGKSGLSTSTERWVQVAAGAVITYILWQLSVMTVMTIWNQGNVISSLNQQIAACRAEKK